MKNPNIVMRPLCADNYQIERVSSYKLLGVVISEELKWNHHIDYLVTKASKRLCLMTSEKTGVNTSDLLSIGVLSWSILEYTVWQKRALKIIDPDCSYDQALMLTNEDTLSDRRDSLFEKFHVDRRGGE